MKRNLVLLMVVGLTANGAAIASGSHVFSPELRKLDVSAGRWVFHGQTMATASGKAGPWTWHEDCHWSENRKFMVCSFSNDWAGRAVNSVVVDTWNRQDKSYWHYELFDGGDSGAQPFISKMTIHGDTRIEYAEGEDHGKKTKTRITYVFDSPTHVKVKIEVSRNGANWMTVDKGTGVKQARARTTGSNTG